MEHETETPATSLVLVNAGARPPCATGSQTGYRGDRSRDGIDTRAPTLDLTGIPPKIIGEVGTAKSRHRRLDETMRVVLFSCWN